MLQLQCIATLPTSSPSCLSATHVYSDGWESRRVRPTQARKYYAGLMPGVAPVSPRHLFQARTSVIFIGAVEAFHIFIAIFEYLWRPGFEPRMENNVAALIANATGYTFCDGNLLKSVRRQRLPGPGRGPRVEWSACTVKDGHGRGDSDG